MRLPAGRCWSSGAPSFAFSAGYLGVQGVQPLFPQGPVLVQPFIDLSERLGAKTVDPPLRLLANVDESRLPQHSQMPRYPLAGQLPAHTHDANLVKNIDALTSLVLALHHRRAAMRRSAAHWPCWVLDAFLAALAGLAAYSPLRHRPGLTLACPLARL
jgi:hypothetical protein